MGCYSSTMATVKVPFKQWLKWGGDQNVENENVEHTKMSSTKMSSIPKCRGPGDAR